MPIFALLLKTFIVKTLRYIGLLSAWLFSICSAAQNHELGLNAGATNFLGDVGNYGFTIPRGYFGQFQYRFSYQQYYGLRVSGGVGRLEARDEWSGFEERQLRNLSFRSDIWDLKALLEINFFRFDPRSRDYNKTFYIFGGFGVFGYNPQAFYGDEWVDLRPLGTEGQGTPMSNQAPYGVSDIIYPFGFGYKHAFNEHWQFHIEFMAHSTGTDYLDDVSGTYVNPTQLAQFNGFVAADLSDRSLLPADRTGYARGNSANNDWYFYTGIGLVWRFTSNREVCARFWGR